MSNLNFNFLLSLAQVSRSSSIVSGCTTPWTMDCQVPLSIEFSGQEYWRGLPFLSPGIFLTQGLNLGLLHCRQIDSLPSEPLRNPMVLLFWSKIEHDLTARNLLLFLLSNRKRPGFMKSTWMMFRFTSCLCCILGIYCLSLILSVSL